MLSLAAGVTLSSGLIIDNQAAGGAITLDNATTPVIGAGMIAEGALTSDATINIGAGDFEFIIDVSASGSFVNGGQINLSGATGNAAALYIGPPPKGGGSLSATYGNISVTDGFIQAGAADQAASGGGASGDITLNSDGYLLATASLANTAVTFAGAGDLLALGQTAVGTSTYQQVRAISGFGAGDTIALVSDGTAMAVPAKASYSSATDDLTIANASGATLATLDIGAGYSSDAFVVTSKTTNVANTGATSFSNEYDVKIVPALAITSSGEASSEASQTITGTVTSGGGATVAGQTVTLTDNGVALAASAPIIVQSNGTFSASIVLPNAGVNAIVASVSNSAGSVGTSAAVDDWLTTAGATNSSNVDGLSVNVGDSVNVAVGGAGDYLNVTGTSAVATATGSKDNIALAGLNDWAALNGSGEAETATGSGGYVVMNGASDNSAMNGPSEAASASSTGANDYFSLGGSNDWVTMYGANDGATATGADVSVTQGGTGDWANLLGQGDAMTATGSTASATLGGTDQWATLNGSGDAGTATGATDYVVLGSSNEWVALKGAGDSVTGSGNGDYVEFGGSSATADLTGNTKSYVFDASFGNVVISDFNATSDTMQFSKSDFASWSALSPGHIVQGALGAVITFDAGDTVTLKGVSEGSLVSTHFSFV